MDDITLSPGGAESDDSLSTTLLRLEQWSEAFKAQLDSQLKLFDVLEEHLLVELRVHYNDDFDPRFIRDLLDAILHRIISQQPLVYDESEHAPYRPQGVIRQEIPEARRDVIVQVVEGVAAGLLGIYQDFLERHWSGNSTVHDAERYDTVVGGLIDEHSAALAALVQPDALAGATVATLRMQIEVLQAAWHEQDPILAVSSEPERAVIERQVRSNLPDWIKLLTPETRSAIEESHIAVQLAQEQVKNLLGHVQSLRAHARSCAKDYLRENLDREMESDLIRVKRRMNEAQEATAQEFSLTELVAQGPLEVEQLYMLSSIGGPIQHYQMPSIEQIDQLLREVDAPGSYLSALTACYQRDEVKLALADAYDARLQHSLLVARSAGHLSAQSHDRISSIRAGAQGDIRVSALAPIDTHMCSDLLLFYREGADGVPEDLVLYAPDKPDRQEWIELRSLRALSEEVGGWLKEEVGRQYLVSQLAHISRKAAQAYALRVADLPSEWRVDRDLRGTLSGYRACVEQGVDLRALEHQARVDQTTSPRWYSRLGIEERRVLVLVMQQAGILEQAFHAELKTFEPFVDFARRTIRESIKPYLQAKGIDEPIDPESILMEYSSTLNDGKPEVINLLELVCYGYDDNSGIDHPDRGVRSALGQDLSQLRSADFARYARRAYVGQAYIDEIRAKFLDGGSVQYRQRQQLFGRALLSAMDRDLRIALDSQQITLAVYNRLRNLPTTLGLSIGAGKVVSTSEAVVGRDALIQCTVADCPALGVYVLRYIDEGQSHDWLYTPQAPDGILLRPYDALNQVAADELHDYLLNRVALSSRGKVRTRLIALAEGGAHRDTLREFREVTSIAGEYDAYIEHALTDVDDATSSRAEVIKGQVFKGIVFALPLTMVLAPFAIALTAYFFVAPLRQAIIDHTKGDTAGALRHWLEASWGALGAVLHLPGIGLSMLKPLFTGLRRSIIATHGSAGRATLGVRSMKFSRQWAFKRPGNLQEVTEEGIWKGTLRTVPSSDAPAVEHFVRDGGRYFKVIHDVEHGTLRVLKANRPYSFHQPAIARGADGRWVPNNTGVRGGSPVEDAGWITQLRQISRGNGNPDAVRGAFQGEAVVATFNPGIADNYVFSLNAQTCVVVSLYNPATRAGAVIHFDHNIRALIDRSLRDVLGRLRSGSATGEIRGVMAGGDWLTGADIGGPVRALLRRQGVQPSWEHWSYSSCLGNTYGLTLDLGTGVTRVYKASQNLVARLYDPILRSARFNAPGVPGRADLFMRRFKAEPLVQKPNGAVLDTLGQPAQGDALAQQAFAIVEI